MMAKQKGWQWMAALCIFLLVGGLGLQSSGLINSRPIPAGSVETLPVWGSKPVLGYFFLTQELRDLAARELNLSPADLAAIQELAVQEVNPLKNLKGGEISSVLAQGPVMQEMGLALPVISYQTRVGQSLKLQQDQLKRILGETAYTNLVAWIEARWQIERMLHGSQQARAQQTSGARTYTVYAAQYDAGGAYTVALPDQCVKFANNGIASLTKCADYGYEDGANYTVSISYQGRSVSVQPREAGPWNVDDTYWATTADPTPRRMFTDLGLGVPQAQAAFFDNYNGGLDQFGRKVKQPFAIDLSFEVARDLGISANAWVDVTFSWTADWEAASEETSVGGGVPQVIIPVATGTADADGRLYHEVQPGQTLWAIALAYEVTIDDLEAWNDLSRQDSLLIGERLVIPDIQTQSLGTPTPVGMILAEDGHIVHLVQPGENLTLISERYGVELGTVLALNGIEANSALQIGQQLLMRAADGAPARPLTAIEKLTPQADGKYYHRVAEGESLSAIADTYAVSVADLMSWNTLSQGTVLQPGDELLLQVTPPVTPPVTATATRAPATSTPRATHTVAPTSTVTPSVGSGTSAVLPTALPEGDRPAGNAAWAWWVGMILLLGAGIFLWAKLAAKK